MAQRLPLFDATFVNVETRATPMHVGGLQIFQKPAGASPLFVRELVDRLRSEPPTGAPWNQKLVRVWFQGFAPAVDVASDIDMQYHVRRIALPEPGGERELGEMVSHLHGTLLDRSRPLWTCHVIDGLEGNRFAIYTKIHHALTDGVNGIRMATRCLATTPDGPWSAPWSWKRPDGPRAPRPAAPRPPRVPLQKWPGHLLEAALPNRERGREPVIRAFAAPRSALNGKVTAARRVATQALDLERLKRVAQASQATLNDVFLAVCAGALRRHLSERNGLPDKALVAGVPVSLRAPDDIGGGNAVGFLWSTLATDAAEPLERLRRINASMRASKEHLYRLPQQARLPYTLATMTPATFVILGGLGAVVRPPMNLTVSNVPGPSQTLYANGARLEAIYPISIPSQGQSLNITGISYDGKLDIGFVGSRDAVPHLQHLAVYAGEALDELEAALGIGEPKTAPEPVRQAA